MYVCRVCGLCVPCVAYVNVCRVYGCMYAVCVGVCVPCVGVCVPCVYLYVCRVCTIPPKSIAQAAGTTNTPLPFLDRGLICFVHVGRHE